MSDNHDSVFHMPNNQTRPVTDSLDNCGAGKIISPGTRFLKSYIKLHRATKSYVELQKATESYLELHKATVSRVKLWLCLVLGMEQMGITGQVEVPGDVQRDRRVLVACCNRCKKVNRQYEHSTPEGGKIWR